jgi:hypothetical protein
MNSIHHHLRASVFLAVLFLLTGSALAALEPGLRLRVYDIGEDMDRLYALKPDQTPNYEKILPSIDISDASGFNGLTKNFRAEVTATIRVEKPGVYAFLLTSDDGARLSVDDRTIVNHDGRHGATAEGGEQRVDRRRSQT